MKKLFIFSSVLCALLQSGCDWLFGEDAQPKESVESKRVEQVAREELAEFRKNMEKFVDGNIVVNTESCAEVTKKISEIRKDVDEFVKASARIMEEKKPDGKEMTWESRHLRLLRDKKVNELAVKYLACDFSTAAAKFVEEVKMAMQEERRYFEAIKKADTAHDGILKETSKWSNATDEQREGEASKLNREISNLDSERQALLKQIAKFSRGKLVGGVQQERERKEHLAVLNYKLNDLDSEIRKKRGQVDAIRQPERNHVMERNVISSTLSEQRRVNDNHRTVMDDISRYIKPKRMVKDVVVDCEKNTTAKLQMVMMSKRDVLIEKESELKQQIALLKEARLAIPVSDLVELQRIRKSFTIKIQEKQPRK